MHLIETALCNKLFNILAKLHVYEFSTENLMIMIFHQTEEKVHIHVHVHVHVQGRQQLVFRPQCGT